MNLLKDPWLPVIRKDKTKEKIAIHQLLDRYDSNPVTELEAPRPDFKSALYQLLIGIVQVSAMPEDEEEWLELFETPYNSDDFSKKVLKYEDCFEIDSDGPAFMQDLELEEAEEKPISTLLIEAPGAKTVKDNQDHFVKTGVIEKVDIYWAATALYTLQTFAPSGGAGHRVGLRGGGPLTTILRPQGSHTLWEILWINTISEDYIGNLQGNISLKNKSDIFPWLKASKISITKGSELFSPEVHPVHHFFGMPRRIRLIITNACGTCDITGEESKCYIESYKTRNYGNNYDGAWSHPLNAYKYDPKKPDEFPLSIKGQPGGIVYQHWLGQAIVSEKVFPAFVVKLVNESEYRKTIINKRGFALWASGYDMDNMKARCWYDSTMPFYSIHKSKVRIVSFYVEEFIKQAHEISSNIKSCIKMAWANRPKDLSGDMSVIDSAFWHNTEASFYEILEKLIINIDNIEVRNSLVVSWSHVLKYEAETLFDNNALAQQEDGLNMKRVIKARENLGKSIGKMIKKLKTLKEEV